MKINWKAAAHIGAQIVGAVVPGVSLIESAVTQLADQSGKGKQDAVVEMVKGALLAAESLTARDLAQDRDVETATRKLIDAVVALHIVVARKSVAAPIA